jgi:hypothetical protein
MGRYLFITTFVRLGMEGLTRKKTFERLITVRDF